MRAVSTPLPPAVGCMTPAARIPPLLRRSCLSNVWRLGASGGVLPRGSPPCRAEITRSLYIGVSGSIGLKCRLPWLQQQGRLASGAASGIAAAAPPAAVRIAQSAKDRASGVSDGSTAMLERESASGPRSPAYPFTEIEAKWQR